MPEAHSEWSASGFKKILLCPGSKVLEVGKVDKPSVYSAEGTAAHNLLEMCLRTGRDAQAFKGRVLQADGFEFEVDDDMVDHIQWTIDQVKDYVGDDGVLMTEQKLYYADYLGVDREAGWGTGDVVIIRGDEVIVADLKYGKGVGVSVEKNPQLMLYGLGAVAEHNGIAADLVRARLVILQPRTSRRPSEWDISVEELEAWGRSTARSIVNTVRNAQEIQGPEWNDTFLRPGEEQCRFCKAKATCPKLREEVAGTVCDGSAPATPDEFEAIVQGEIEDPRMASEDDAWLAAVMAKADLIEDWLKAVRAEVERRLLAGGAVPGYKLVQGKQGNRAWTSKSAAEEAMLAMRLKQDEMYERSIISPTAAEKLLAKESPRRWTKLQALITRADGKPSVAPLSDKRPALEVKPVADDFDDVETFDDLI